MAKMDLQEELKDRQDQMETRKQRYREARERLSVAEKSKAKLEEKKGELEETLSDLNSRVNQARTSADKLMKAWAAGNAKREEATKARRGIADLEAEVRDTQSLLEAITDELEAVQEVVSEKWGHLSREKEGLWNAVSQLENIKALAASHLFVKRAFLARRRSSPAGRAPKFVREFVEEVFGGVSVSDEEEKSLLQSLEQNFD